MPEDYSVKSGAKDMLSTAIAEVLTLRPRAPVTFLASHFQGLVQVNKSAAVVSSLRACHPGNPLFPSAVEKFFHDLAATEAASTPSLSSSNSSGSLPQRSSSITQQGLNPSRKVNAGSPATISEVSFLQILQQLSVDFPKHLQTRLLDSVVTDANAGDLSSKQSVGMARFQRSVQACLLVEELIDAATLLFQALQLNSSNRAVTGGVDSDTLMNALRSAAASQFPHDLTAVLTPLLDRSTDPDSPATTTKNRNVLQLNDVYEVLFDLAFVP